MHTPTPEQLRQWDHEHVWHPFTPMQAYREEQAPIIECGEGFELIDVDGTRYLDGISSLWCNVHGHGVPQLDDAIRRQLDRIGHSTLLGLSSPPSIELARRLVEITPPGLNKVFYSDSGATAVEAALKIAYQYHQQADQSRQHSNGRSVTPARQQRNLFATVAEAYHGDTIGSVSLGNTDLFHRTYRDLLFQTVHVPAPVTLRRPAGQTAEEFLRFCFDEVERVVSAHADRLVAFVIEPIVQGAAGILVHPPGYLRHVREVTQRHGVLLIADEVAVGFGRTGTMFACEQEQVQPDLLCLAKGLTGGYLPLAATLATDEIYDAFLGDPSENRTFFHGHTYTGNALGCAAALASLDLFTQRDLLSNIARNAETLKQRLARLANHPHVAEVRQQGIMAGIELVQDRQTLEPFPRAWRMGHRVTLAARERRVIIRPLGDVVVLMPAPGMPGELVEHLCEQTLAAIDEAVGSLR